MYQPTNSAEREHIRGQLIRLELVIIMTSGDVAPPKVLFDELWAFSADSGFWLWWPSSGGGGDID